MVTTRSGSKAATPARTTAAMSSSSSSRSSPSSTTTAGPRGAWFHAPGRVTLFWMAVSLPLVIWDSVYVLGRPHTMEGGWLHWPLWVPYRLYGEVDHVYGWKAVRDRNGFTAAQGSLNVVETVLYLAYVWLALTRARPLAATATAGRAPRRVLVGRPAAAAVLLAFSAAVMTLSKTVLYWANEYFSHFSNIGHNATQDLILLWIIPNGAWLIFPTYMIYAMGGEILDGLTAASSGLSIKTE